jgi:4-amino-4-deoxy-L-arabinose transferase-like glycosyltransferase
MVSLRNPDYARYFFIELNFGSFLSETSHHPEPFHYYLPVLLGGFFPWSFFLPVALVRAWQRRDQASHGGTLFALLWAGFYFAFFSAAESKLATYILPVFPPLALLVGRLWQELATAPTPALRKAVLWSFAPFLLLPLAVIVFMQTHPLPLMEMAAQYGLTLGKAASPLLVLIVGLAAAFALVVAKRSQAGFAGIVVSFAAFIALFATFIVPLMTQRRSSYEVAMKLDALLPEGEPIACYSSLRNSALFYTDRQLLVLKSGRQLDDYLSSNDPAYVLISSRRYEKMGLEAPVVHEAGGELLISNRETL